MTRRKSPPARRGVKSTSTWRRTLLRSLFRLSLVGAVVLAVWMVQLDRQVTSRFEGQRWDVPSRVYARPLELYEGASLSAEGLEWELQALGYVTAARPQSPGSYSRRGDHFELATRGFDFPDTKEVPRRLGLSIQNNQIVSWTGSDKSPIVRLEPLEMGGIYPAHHEDRVLVRLADTPALLKQTLLEVEDRDFDSHFGVSPLAILRAMYANLTAGRVVQGGSTLTQQLVKNFYLTNERSLLRKVNEAGMAVLLDARYSKDDILEAYLNEVFLGQSGKRAIHGFGLASQYYFGRDLASLEAHHIALLVGLVKGATLYDPRRHPQRAKQRRDLVLSVLEERGILTADASEKARKKELEVIRLPSFSDNRYPAYIDLVRRHLARDYADEDLRREGLRIFSALDPQVQESAERAATVTLKQLDGDRKDETRAETAMVVTGTQSAEVLALVGGRDPRYAGFNRALDAQRSIGSLIKPFVYLTALSQPERYNLVTLLQDEPFSLASAGGKTWKPQNYDRQAHGPVPLFRALANSYNLSTVRLGMDLGLDTIISQLRALGVKSELLPYPSLLLGAVTMTPVEVAELYQTLASNGFNMPLRTIRAVTTAEGEVLSRYNLSVEQVADPRAVHLLQYAMQAVMREGTGRSTYNTLSSAQAFAGKTGTTDNNRDSWFAGFGGDYLAVVWVGRDDNESTRFTGASGALRLWTQIMARMPQLPLQPAQPDGIEFYWVDDREQALSDEQCPGARLLPFTAGSQPNRLTACAEGLGGGEQKSWFEGLFQ